MSLQCFTKTETVYSSAGYLRDSATTTEEEAVENLQKHCKDTVDSLINTFSKKGWTVVNIKKLKFDIETTNYLDGISIYHYNGVTEVNFIRTYLADILYGD
jgi:hypothetical protein